MISRRAVLHAVGWVAITASVALIGSVALPRREPALVSLATMDGVDLPDVAVEDDSGRSLRLASLATERLTVLFIVSIDDCIVCQAEVLSWRDLAEQEDVLVLRPIGVGGDREIYRRMAAQEALGASFTFDDDHAILRALALPEVTPTRILILDGQVVGVSQTSDLGLLVRARELLQRIRLTGPEVRGGELHPSALDEGRR